jgi:hypothetical protein
MTAPLQTTAAQQMLQLQLPSAPATRLHLTAPGNVELKSGAHLVSREVVESENETRFEMLAQRGPISLVLSLNNRILRQDRVMVARSVILDEVLQGIERLYVTATFSILHGASDRLELELPGDFELTQVSADTLSRWGAVAQENGTQRLTIELRQPTAEPVTALISAVRSRETTATGHFPSCGRSTSKDMWPCWDYCSRTAGACNASCQTT